IRSAPNLSANKLPRVLKNDEVVTVFGIMGGWAAIDPSAKQWVARRYLVSVDAVTSVPQEISLTTPSTDHHINQVDTIYEVFYSDAEKRQRSRDVPLYKLTDRVGFFHKGSMQIDVDGSPRAYYPGNANPLRLDNLSSADSQGGSTTYIQGKQTGSITALGPRPGFYVSATSLR